MPLLFVHPAVFAGSMTEDRPVEVVINASETHAPISQHLYGQFIEHIRDIINKDIWAEMIADRKFYFAISEIPILGRDPQPQDPFWVEIGSADAIGMDRERAFTGEQSPVITLDRLEPRGIRQTGLILAEGREYTGRIILAADDDARVALRLVWNDSEDGYQTVTLDVPQGDYVTHEFEFVAGAATDDAALEITATGTGSVWIGALSMMPADNMEGYRREVITKLQSIDAGVYRFPGGNFVSAHEWQKAVGDIDKRPPVIDVHWGALQPNDVGTDEFITLTRLLDVEPYITVNAGFGDAWSAAKLVEYANGSTDTPMGKWRADNGHPEPYGIKYWGVGNEAWGSWQMGAMALDQFVHKHNQFADAMLAADPSIILIGSGAMPDAMTCSGESEQRTGQILTEYLGPADWTGGLFQHSLHNMDMISEHFYAYADRRFDIETGESVARNTDEPLVEWMRRPANHVKTKVDAYHDYLELIPELQEKRIPIALAEWAYAGVPSTSYRVVPANAWVFHELFRHSDLFTMANFTFANSLLSMNRTEAALSPTGLLFKLYSNHYGHIPVTVSGNRPQTEPVYGPGGQDPRINAGSPTFPLDVAAALTEDGSALTIAVINPTEQEESINLEVRGVRLADSGTLWRMAPDNLDAQILPGQKPEVEIEELEFSGGLPGQPAFAPFSVSLYRIEIDGTVE
ncbi:hypothetical protein QA596_01550 [Balneolales bacterium ANBcel1]|nr:hypothetical protein [Balneolales bacterium ANBcel1]